jgi:Carbohydrate binding module (family 35)/Carbohydrate binding module (family 6)
MRRNRLLISSLAIGLTVAGGAVTVAAFPAAAAATAYEAESAALSGGAAVASDHTGYTGAGFVAGYTDGNKGTAATTFTVDAGPAGTTTATLRYANGTGSTMSLSLYVNGARLRQIRLPVTGDWNSWSTETETVALNAGSNTVAYRFDSTDLGNVNLDNLTVTPVSPYEAESAALSGGAAVASDHTGYTGAGFVAGYTDGNKGTAATTFTVSTAMAGSTALTLRYANGTGSTMSLSLYVNGAKLRQIQLPVTGDWNAWSTESETVALNAGSNTVVYRFDSTDLGNVNLDNIAVASAGGSPSPSPSGSPTPGQTYEAETAFSSGGPSVATATAGYTGTGYLTGFSSQGARVISTVNVPAAGSYPVTLRYANSTGSARTMSLYVNGLRSAQVSAAAGNGWLSTTQTLSLRSGVNLIGYEVDSGDSGGISIDSISVNGGTPMASRGATVPYTEYRAASATTNGTVLAANRTYLAVAAEATGRQAVQLSSTGQYVQFTLTRPANSIVIRYSMPDSADGTGLTAPIALYANGGHIQDITLSSRYAWVYGAYPYTNTPSQGSAHHFFDETRALIGNWPAGTLLKLQKDPADNAPYYTIDVVDAEQVDAALPMPANFLSITGYGATAGDGTDDTSAINNTIAAARSAGKGVWIPVGTFTITARLNVAGVAVRGAGEWYSVLQGTNGKGGFYATGSGVQIADLTISGDVTYRDDLNFDTGIEGNFGTGSLIFDVWIEHTKVGMWIDSGTNGLYAAGVRVRDTIADGTNLHANVTNTRVDQSVARNTGDDALAMFSEGTAVTNCAYTFDTVQSPLLANAIGIYGGNGDAASDNLLSDTVTASAGIAVSTRFGIPFSGPTTVQRNTLTRTGGYEPNWQTNLGALWIYANQSDITTPVSIADNTIVDSTYQAVLLSDGHQISNLLLDHDTITGAGTYGIDIKNVTGSMTASYVTIAGAASGGLNNPGGYTIVRGPGNTGW